MIITPTQYDLGLLAEIQKLRVQTGRSQFDDGVVASMAFTHGLYDELDSLRFLAKIQREEPATGEANLVREQCS